MQWPRCSAKWPYTCRLTVGPGRSTFITAEMGFMTWLLSMGWGGDRVRAPREGAKTYTWERVSDHGRRREACRCLEDDGVARHERAPSREGRDACQGRGCDGRGRLPAELHRAGASSRSDWRDRPGGQQHPHAVHRRARARRVRCPPAVRVPGGHRRDPWPLGERDRGMAAVAALV